MLQFAKIEQSLNNICNECSFHNTEDCVKNKCYIGFSEKVIRYAQENSVVSIADGEKLIPHNDMKYYKEELIAESIAEVCKLCKQCRENHSEQCIISLSRCSLENAILKENTPYPGSVLMYLMEVSKQNPGFAEKIKLAYSK